jgi:hypothetical protein
MTFCRGPENDRRDVRFAWKFSTAHERSPPAPSVAAACKEHDPKKLIGFLDKIMRQNKELAIRPTAAITTQEQASHS